jgi:hypothetical protein
VISQQPFGERMRIAVVSYRAYREDSPRGDRTRHVCAALRERADVELIAGPIRLGTRPRVSPLHRRVGAKMVGPFLVDGVEPWSWRRLGAWKPDVDAAVLVGAPFSPIGIAARALARLGIPYVVDVGDPWALTASAGVKAWTLRQRRGCRMEASMWSHASAAVVTTAGQRDDLIRLFPPLNVLVRPNGYEPIEAGATTLPSTSLSGRLVLAHFGTLYGARIDIGPLLERLAAAGRWTEVVVRQFGADWSSPLLRRRIPGVRFETSPTIPWPAAVTEAGSAHAVLVVGNRDSRQLPSKVVSYLTLPVPRIGIVADARRDAIAEYVRPLPGWLVLEAGDPHAPALVAQHVAREWANGELAPPAAEAWPRVARTIADFVLTAISCDDRTIRGAVAAAAG